MIIGFRVAVINYGEKKIELRASRDDDRHYQGTYPIDMSVKLVMTLFVEEARQSFKQFDDQQDKLKLEYTKEQLNTCRDCDGTGRSRSSRGQCWTCDGRGKL